MFSTPIPGQTQTRTLQVFTLLHNLRTNWPGSLILNTGLDETGIALALASTIAGAVCLTLEPEPTLLRNASRSGACDFIVNTLDEALRAMKNELRKHNPLSVGLEGNPGTLLQEILELGLLPQLFTSPIHTEAASIFQSQGATILNLEATLPPNNPNWHLETFTFNTPNELRTFDTQALSLLRENEYLRRRWLQTAPRILHRERPPHRTLWLTDHERNLLTPHSTT
jgi:urocanate hydratase